MMTREEALSDKNIDAWIEKNSKQYVQDVIDLINIKSVSVQENSNTPYGQGCSDVLDKALSKMEQFGFDVRNEKYYGLASKIEKNSDKSLGVFLHLDVVPEGTGWTYPPYNATIDNGFLIGRGVGDNKGPAVAVMYALKYLKDNNLLNNNVYQYFGLAEETGMTDIERFLNENNEPDISIVADVTFPVVYGEKGIIDATFEKVVNFKNIKSFSVGTASNIVPPLAEMVIEIDGNKNINLFDDNKKIEAFIEGRSLKIIATGISKHAATPDGSLNAAKVLLDAILTTDLINDEEKKELQFINSTIEDNHGQSIDVPFEDAISGKISHIMGMVRFDNSVIKLNYNLRYPVTLDGKNIEKSMVNLFNSHNYDVNKFHNSTPSLIDPDSDVVKNLTRISNEMLNQSKVPSIMGGGTYARKLKNGVAFGIIDSDGPRLFEDNWGGAHQPDESVYIKMFLKGIKIYIKSFAYLDSYLTENKSNLIAL